MDKETIKAVAKQHGLKLTDIANRLGMIKQNLNKTLNGNMTIATLERIANAIGCSVADFYTYNQPTPTQCKCPKCGASLKLTLTTED